MMRNSRLIGMAPGALTGAPTLPPTASPLPTLAPTVSPTPKTSYLPTNSECECVDTDDGATDSVGKTCANFKDAIVFQLTYNTGDCYFDADTNCISEGDGTYDYYAYDVCEWTVLLDTGLRVEEFETDSYQSDQLSGYVRSRARRASRARPSVSLTRGC